MVPFYGQSHCSSPCGTQGGEFSLHMLILLELTHGLFVLANLIVLISTNFYIVGRCTDAGNCWWCE